MGMRSIFLLFVCSLIAQLPAQVIPIGGGGPNQPFVSWEKQSKWVETRDLDGRFRVLTPADWEHRVDSVETAIGILAYHTFFLKAPVDTADNDIYTLSYVDYPTGALHHDSTELVQEFLAATVESAVERMQGEILFDTERGHGAYPGRYWRIDYLDGSASVRTQAFVIDNRYYSLQTIGRTGRGLNSSTDKYFESFTVF